LACKIYFERIDFIHPKRRDIPPFRVAGITESPAAVLVMSYGIFHGGFIQLVAGAFEIVKGNTFGATAFVSYGTSFGPCSAACAVERMPSLALSVNIFIMAHCVGH
jgi:succinate-acetate transporter protein